MRELSVQELSAVQGAKSYTVPPKETYVMDSHGMVTVVTEPGYTYETSIWYDIGAFMWDALVFTAYLALLLGGSDDSYYYDTVYVYY